MADRSYIDRHVLLANSDGLRLAHPCLHLVGMPRSGTTAALQYLTDGYNFCGRATLGVNEPFNHWFTLEHVDGVLQLKNKQHPSLLTADTVKDRWRTVMSESTGQSLIMKHIFNLNIIADNNTVLDFMLACAPGDWVVIRRRDRFEQFLSWLIGDHTDTWLTTSMSATEAHRKSTLAFTANFKYVKVWLETEREFENKISELQHNGCAVHSVWYESIQTDCDQVGRALFNDTWDAWDSGGWFSDPHSDRIKKLRSFDEKADLIQNYTEIRELFKRGLDGTTTA